MHQDVTRQRHTQQLHIGLSLILLVLVCSLAACADTGGTQASGSVTYGSVMPTVTPKGGTIPQSSAVAGRQCIRLRREVWC